MQSWRLSNYVRYFKPSEEQVVIESVLREEGVLLTPVLRAVVEALEDGPLDEQELSARVGADGSALSKGLGLLRSMSLIVRSEEEDLARMRDGLGDLVKTPAIDQVEMTNACPMKCVMCGRGAEGTERPIGFMDVELFRSVVDQVVEKQQETKPLALHNSGESMLHQQLEDCVRVASARGLAPEVSTNPAYLPLTRYLSMRDAGIARIVLSLDGMNAQTLHTIRGLASRFDDAMVNVEAIIAHRRSTGECTPELVFQMIRMDANRDQRDAFLTRFGGLEHLSIKAYLKPLDAATPHYLIPAGDRPRQYFCRAPWRTVVVLWDGRVVPCCYDDQGRMILGDLKTESLDQIWHSPRAEELRRQHLDDTLPESSPCGKCVHRPSAYKGRVWRTRRSNRCTGSAALRTFAVHPILDDRRAQSFERLHQARVQA